ncbi:hypothetical protein [Leyella stercorea]|uniref:hypothetical protein n=1 Tax=Leyella stercorea TaxID=363265 RepID=UPI00266C4C8F|nr:hypothetical protein [Leyella stercorea]
MLKRYAPTDADVRIGRRGCPHRSAQMSASVDADVRIGRRGWLQTKYEYALRLQFHVLREVYLSAR